MTRCAVIETASGKVENVIELEPGADWIPPAGRTVLQSDAANIGDLWTGATFTAGPAAPPSPFAADVKFAHDYVVDAGLDAFLANAAPTAAAQLAALKATIRMSRALARLLKALYAEITP